MDKALNKEIYDETVCVFHTLALNMIDQAKFADNGGEKYINSSLSFKIDEKTNILDSFDLKMKLYGRIQSDISLKVRIEGLVSPRINITQSATDNREETKGAVLFRGTVFTQVDGDCDKSKNSISINLLICRAIKNAFYQVIEYMTDKYTYINSKTL